VHDRRLARVVGRCQDLPGHELFQYIDDDGELHAIDSQDVNEYLKEITHEDITAKDFRTWNGTVLAAEALLAALRGGGPRGRSKRVVTRCIDAVAQRLGNTKTVCRKCYVHPAVVEAYLDGTLAAALAAGRRASASRSGSSETGLRPEEAAVLAFLRGRSGRETVAEVAQAAAAAAPAA
jgi:DNA topoisomerase-1